MLFKAGQPVFSVEGGWLRGNVSHKILTKATESRTVLALSSHISEACII